MKYKYEDLIDAYFASIKNSLEHFSVESCREYVKHYKNNFKEENFMRKLALKLVKVDDEWPDEYSLDSDFERIEE
ncbi:hypothetical protein M9Y10_037423 [Tritrichomonas musculus]|uniref:Uncharacterized protein n=1 Tax=Tritrichomonas musculus TaxID=1915356 RepID=A0ABR2GU65_9EUKA